MEKTGNNNQAKATKGEIGMNVEIVLTTTMEVPKGSEVVTSPSGAPSGIKLPTGEMIKPWITFEKAEEVECTTRELEELGCFWDDTDRQITPAT